MRITIIFLLIFSYCSSAAQTPQWKWLKGMRGADDGAKGYAITLDPQSNVYVTGYGGFGNMTVGTFTLNTPYFVSKFDSSGNVLWAKNATGGYADRGLSIATDKSGNVCVTGSTKCPVIFGTDTIVPSLAGYDNFFLTKYDPSGNALWALGSKGGAPSQGDGVAIDQNGNIYVTGYFTQLFIIGNDTLTDTTNTGQPRLFILKTDPSGNLTWVKMFYGMHSPIATSNHITCDLNGNIVLTGNNSNNGMTFGSNTTTGPIYTVKFDSAGNVIWAKGAGFGSAVWDYVQSIASDNEGSVYITGGFTNNTFIFGNDTLYNTPNIYSHGDIFIAKYDAAGNPAWAKRAGGIGNDWGAGISTDTANNIYLAGTFDQQHSSTTISFDTVNISSNSTLSDFFITKFNSAGNVQWAVCAQYSVDYLGLAIAADAYGNSYMVGDYTNAITLGTQSMYSMGIKDIFVARLNNPPMANSSSTEVDFNELSIFPNPASARSSLRFNRPLYNASLLIKDNLGQPVMHQRGLNGIMASFDCSHLPAGLYFIQLTEDERIIATAKLVIADK